MKLHPDYTGWTDVCEDCFSRIFRAYDGAWIAIADDEIRTVSNDCRRHRPINVDPPKDDQCPHGVPWRRCTDGCINVDMEYVPQLGHEIPTSLIIPRVTVDGLTTQVVTCCHCRQDVRLSTYWSNRWYGVDKRYACDDSATSWGYHEPTVGASRGEKIRNNEYWGTNA